MCFDSNSQEQPENEIDLTQEMLRIFGEGVIKRAWTTTYKGKGHGLKFTENEKMIYMHSEFADYVSIEFINGNVVSFTHTPDAGGLERSFTCRKDN